MTRHAVGPRLLAHRDATQSFRPIPSARLDAARAAAELRALARRARTMKTCISAVAISLFVLGAACSRAPRQSGHEASANIDSLNARLVQAYRTRDPRAYGALYTDSAVFEWPAFNTVRGRAGMEAMARSNWAALNDMDLELTVSSRRVAPNHATEFGAFEQSWRDSSGVRMTEFGRYVVVLARHGDSSWLIDRFFGFADSTRPPPTRP
jgi:ketosteroid isomerase-like protein